MTKVLSRPYTMEKFNIDYDNPRFVLLGGVITQWSEDNSHSQPTEEELVVWYDGLTAYWSTKEVLNTRRREYPDVVECVHALLDGGDTLTDLQAQRTTVKNKYPKGGN